MSKRFVTVALLVILVSACTRPASTPIPLAEKVQNVPSSTPTALLDTNLPASTPTANVPISTETPAVIIAPTEPACLSAPRVQIGQQVTVVVEDWDKLKLRSEPVISTETVIMELPQSTQLIIQDGPVCVADSETQITYWFWKVAVLPAEEIGWIAEGEYPRYFIR